ncbi:MAG: DUF484 family protein [Paracoccus sp. (in: a-proteobacteria)]|nr:DUF484 family protein [Paracoccus sp. (in: a-proteobacteria)]
MTNGPSAGLSPELRDRLLADPEAVLGDREVMHALLAVERSQQGDNVIDMRARAMQALEDRLNRLETTHDSVIAAAFDNQNGMAIVHRAVIGLLETVDLDDLVACLQSDIAPILRIETLRLLIEVEPAMQRMPEDVHLAPAGAVDRIIAAGRRAPRGDDIVLRAASPITQPIHGRAVASEALIPLDMGARKPRAMIVMGSADPTRFSPAQGTDLLRFFAQVFRLVLLARLRG